MRALHLLKPLMAVAMSTILSTSVYARNPADMDFLTQQKQYARVNSALQYKTDALARKLDALNLKNDNINILIVAYKSEARLDVYAKESDSISYKKLDSYSICTSSGKLGPKRKQGDRQVPEGFYRIDRFNPVSNYHLSLGINYPNAADKLKTRAANPGGDIFIHGSCVSIGCLAMTDDKIMEIYLYAVYARNNGQKTIPVYMFPFEMTTENMKKYIIIHGYFHPELVDFWQNIKTGYDKFMSDGKPLAVSVTPEGDYRFGP